MAAASALICTRDRPDSLIRAALSLLAPRDADIEIIIIDQSDGRETEHALRDQVPDPRLVYVRTASRGKGAALNQGLGLARSDIVVCTDDDCEAPPNWVASMARELAARPGTAVAFCNVVAAPYDRDLGYIPVFQRTADRRLSSLRDIRKGIGLGAGMALRREAVLAFGGFDETFGPGARFGSGDDWDLALRALMHGHSIAELSSLSVVHYGFRTFAQGRDHALRDWIAIGALCAKPLRAGYAAAILPALHLFVSQALWPPLRDVLRLRRPSGASRIVGFLKGFARGFATPVERATLRFRPTPQRTRGGLRQPQ